MAVDSVPGNWEAGIGERSSSYYTKPFYNKKKELEMRVYWDKGNKHKAVVREVGIKDNGDWISGYPVKTREAESEEEIDQKAVELMSDT